MGRRLVGAQLLLHPPKDYCGVTVITTAPKIQPIIHAGTVGVEKQKNNNKCNTQIKKFTCTYTNTDIHTYNITLLPFISTGV